MEDWGSLQASGFLWRLAHHSLPTVDVRCHRRMAVTSLCSICGETNSRRHSLINCSVARCVWALADDGFREHMCANEDPLCKTMVVRDDGILVLRWFYNGSGNTLGYLLCEVENHSWRGVSKPSLYSFVQTELPLYLVVVSSSSKHPTTGV
jgi:hypothetical protein